MQDEMPTPPGFVALREDLEVTSYRRHLPHWRQEGATYFVTFRLNDGLPAAKLRELKGLREEWEREHPEPRSSEQLEEFARLLTRKQEYWLDQGYGDCLLRVPAHQEILTETLLHFDRSFGACERPRYELNAYVLMPNHVHLLVRPFDTEGESHSLEKILQSWKRHSSREINKERGATGSIWFEESFDRIVRDGHHLIRCLHYIGRNPAKAKMTSEQCPRWICPSWRDFGWKFAE